MSDAQEPRRGLSKAQVGLLGLMVVILLGSVGLRLSYKRQSDVGRGLPADARGLVAESPDETPAEDESPLERTLPYLTEGSFFGLIGFALGYATRKFVKVGLILLAFFFVGLQALVWTGTVDIDWSGLVGKLNALLFNLRENESITAFLTRRVPSAGGMLAGYLIGFRRG